MHIKQYNLGAFDEKISTFCSKMNIKNYFKFIFLTLRYLFLINILNLF
jgi:hypothetical protein